MSHNPQGGGLEWARECSEQNSAQLPASGNGQETENRVSQESNCFSTTFSSPQAHLSKDVFLAFINHKDFGLAQLFCGCRVCLSLTVHFGTDPKGIV